MKVDTRVSPEAGMRIKWKPQVEGSSTNRLAHVSEKVPTAISSISISVEHEIRSGSSSRSVADVS
jgi:hypothetical protein